MLYVYRNIGNLEFERIEVPFETPRSENRIRSSIGSGFDNDGYYDILYWAKAET